MTNEIAPHIARAFELQRKSLTIQEEDYLLSILYYFPCEKALLTDLYFTTGCRNSEARLLTRQHLDEPNSLIMFETLKQQAGVPIYREVPIPHYMMRRLLSLTESYAKPLFSVRHNAAPHRSTTLRWVQDVMMGAGIPEHLATIKQLRHSANSRAIRGGVKKRIREMLLGHRPSSKDETTNDGYGDLLGRNFRKDAAIMGGWNDD